jgi:hypothetical protein
VQSITVFVLFSEDIGVNKIFLIPQISKFIKRFFRALWAEGWLTSLTGLALRIGWALAEFTELLTYIGILNFEVSVSHDWPLCLHSGNHL